MKYAALLVVTLLLSGCLFRTTVYVQPIRPIIPIDQIDRPDVEPLIAELDTLSPSAKQSVEDWADYTAAMRAMIEEYNRQAEQHNATHTSD